MILGFLDGGINRVSAIVFHTVGRETMVVKNSRLIIDNSWILDIQYQEYPGYKNTFTLWPYSLWADLQSLDQKGLDDILWRMPWLMPVVTITGPYSYQIEIIENSFEPAVGSGFVADIPLA